MKQNQLNDKNLPEIGNLDWSDEKKLESLQSVYNYVLNMASEPIEWYKKKKIMVRFFAKLLRGVAIIITTIAALIPMLTDLIKIGGKPLDSVWASIALVIGAALIAADRFFGFSASWMRFVDSEIKIDALLKDFQIDWEMQKAALKGRIPDDSQIQEQLRKCRTFLNHVNEILAEESEQWQNDFRNALKQIGKSAVR